MNKATSLQSFTYLGLVVSKKNVPKNLTNLTLWGYGLQSPPNAISALNCDYLFTDLQIKGEDFDMRSIYIIKP